MSEFIDDFIKTTTNQVYNQMLSKKKLVEKRKKLKV